MATDARLRKRQRQAQRTVREVHGRQNGAHIGIFLEIDILISADMIRRRLEVQAGEPRLQTERNEAR